MFVVAKQIASNRLSRSGWNTRKVDAIYQNWHYFIKVRHFVKVFICKIHTYSWQYYSDTVLRLLAESHKNHKIGMIDRNTFHPRTTPGRQLDEQTSCLVEALLPNTPWDMWWGTNFKEVVFKSRICLVKAFPQRRKRAQSGSRTYPRFTIVSTQAWRR